MSNAEQESISPHEFAAEVASILTAGETDAPDQETDTAAEAPADLEGEATETEPELIEDARGNLHDPETGEFVRKAEEAPADEEEEEVDEEEDAPLEDGEIELVIDDPAVEAFLAKYDGDLSKALKGAVEAQKLIGRKTEESEEFKRLQGELAEMKQMIEEQANRPAPRFVNYDAIIEEDPKRAAIIAEENQDFDAMARAVKVWSAEGPEEAFEASMFVNNVLREAEMNQLREELRGQQSQAAPAGESDEMAAYASVIEKHPDLEKFVPQIAEAAKERPLLGDTLKSGTPAQKAAALEDLYLIVRSRQDPADTSEAIKRVRVRTAAESEKAKADAAVVSASRGSAASGSQPTRVETFLDGFDAHLRSRGLIGSDEQSE